MSQGTTFFQLTGLSGAGKTTLCRLACGLLEQRGLSVDLLDGDELRRTISWDLGFSPEDRLQHCFRVIGLARESKADVVLLALVNPFELTRLRYKQGLGALLIWCRCELETLFNRDTKGLYARTKLPDGDPDKLRDLTGVNQPFDIPIAADLIIDTDIEGAAACAERLVQFILRTIGK